MLKYIIFLLSLFPAAFLTQAQDSKPFIDVRGMAPIPRDVKSYLADVTFTEGYSEEKISLDTIIKTFFEKAKAAGIGRERFKEDKMSYAFLQYGAGGTLYHFETELEADVIKLNQLIDEKSGTMNVVNHYIKYNPVKEEGKVYAAALADAKMRAEKIVKEMGKKLGAVVSVTDYSTDDITKEITTYYPGTADKRDGDIYYFSVRYSIE